MKKRFPLFYIDENDTYGLVSKQSIQTWTTSLWIQYLYSGWNIAKKQFDQRRDENENQSTQTAVLNHSEGINVELFENTVDHTGEYSMLSKTQSCNILSKTAIFAKNVIVSKNFN